MTSKKQAQTEMVLEALKPYSPDPKKFDGYIEWRRVNATGTYADYRKWQAAA